MDEECHGHRVQPEQGCEALPDRLTVLGAHPHSVCIMSAGKLVCLPVCLHISLHICLACNSTWEPALTLSASCQQASYYVYTSLYAPVYPSVYTSVNKFVYQSAYSSVYPSVYPYVYPSVYPSVYPCVYKSVHPSVYTSVYHTWEQHESEMDCDRHTAALPVVSVGYRLL